MGAAVAVFGLAAGYLEPLKNAEDANIDLVQLAVSTVYPAGTVIGEVAATPGVYGAYGSGHVDGTQNPTHILQYTVSTDAAGNIFLATTAVSEWQQINNGAPAYRNGHFSCADLIGFDANALSKMGRLVQGTVTAGHVMIYGG